MIPSLWNAIWLASLYGSIVGLILLIVKKLLKNNLNGKWQYLIWLILIVKLLIPYGPESEVSLFNKVPIKHFISKSTILPSLNSTYDKDTLTTSTDKNTAQNQLTNSNIISSNSSNNTLNKNFNLLSFIKNTIPFVWFTGFIIMFIWLLVAYCSLYLHVYKRRVPINENLLDLLEESKKQLNIKRKVTLLQQDIISTPSLLGVFKIKIILPSNINLSSEEWKYIFIHELTHYKRKDNLMNLLLSFLQTIYWFNPLIWFLFREIRNDIEIATDESSLNFLGNDNVKAYGTSLLSMIVNITPKKFAPEILGMANNKKGMERRIKMINKKTFFDNKKKFITGIGIVCTLALGLALLTNGTTSKDETVLSNNESSNDKTTDLSEPYHPSKEETTPDDSVDDTSKPNEETTETPEVQVITPEEGRVIVTNYNSNFGFSYLFSSIITADNGKTYYEYCIDFSSDIVPDGEGDTRYIVDPLTGDLAMCSIKQFIYDLDRNQIATVTNYEEQAIPEDKLKEIEAKRAERIAFYEQQKLDEENSNNTDVKELTPEEGISYLNAAGYTYDYLYNALVLGANGRTYYEYVNDWSSANSPVGEDDSRLIVDTITGEVARHFADGVIRTHYYENGYQITTAVEYTPIQ